MSVWASIGDFVSRLRGGVANVFEAVRTAFEGDPEMRRKVAFSVAMIALSAKMAKADGIVTQDEVAAFHQIFSVPREEARNVARLYNLAKQDVAGFDIYAERVARLCGSGRANCALLQDILDGLFHVAKADGFIHEREIAYLRRVAEIFEIDEAHFEAMLSRHAVSGPGDAHAVLGVGREAGPREIRRRYRELVSRNHPDLAIARGLPPEFVSIATGRLAAINDAYERLEKAGALR